MREAVCFFGVWMKPLLFPMSGDVQKGLTITGATAIPRWSPILVVAGLRK